jgi:uncharacterized protein YecE (DUF72 family)
MNLYVGTSGYSYPKWKGTFYPKELPSRQMLRYYSTQFRAVEINSTFYRMPEPSSLKQWAAEVPKDFVFTFKAPQQITHRLRLRNAGDPVGVFLNAVSGLRRRLGPLLFQLPPNMKKDAQRLRDFLALLPSRCRAAFEFRHSSWLDEEIFELLREHPAALCIAEADDDLKVPFVRTADWGYLRLRRADYTDAELKERLKRIRDQEWTDAFVFFKHEDEGKGPRFANRLLALAD